MLAFAPFQWLLDGLGWVLASIYDVIPDYGIAIIILTLLIRAVLLPLYTRQIKSMQHMQALQPELQKIKTKYKDKTKQQEEQMRLYREAGVSPFSSCLPLLLQFPFLIAMFSVLRAPLYEPVNEGGQVVAYNVVNNHLPVDSQLFENTLTHTDRNFLAMNLDCTPRQVWTGPPTDIVDTSGNPAQAGLPLRSDDQDVTEPDGQVITSQATLDCGASRSAVDPLCHPAGPHDRCLGVHDLAIAADEPPGVSNGVTAGDHAGHADRVPLLRDQLHGSPDLVLDDIEPGASGATERPDQARAPRTGCGGSPTRRAAGASAAGRHQPTEAEPDAALDG